MAFVNAGAPDKSQSGNGKFRVFNIINNGRDVGKMIYIWRAFKKRVIYSLTKTIGNVIMFKENKTMWVPFLVWFFINLNRPKNGIYWYIFNKTSRKTKKRPLLWLLPCPLKRPLHVTIIIIIIII